jgi:hypothetical protein
MLPPSIGGEVLAAEHALMMQANSQPDSHETAERLTGETVRVLFMGFLRF